MSGKPRTVDEILSGGAIEWANLTRVTALQEHELLRRALETARGQISALVPLAAGRHAAVAEPAWPATLAANIAIGAGLCAEWRLGFRLTLSDWHPGCRRIAPGWTP